MKKRRCLVFFLLIFGAGTCFADIVPLIQPIIIKTYPHARGAFTEGLVWEAGVLYESAGQLGLSSLSSRDLKNATLIRHRKMPAEVFAEGIAVVGDEIIQLTWRNQRAYVYDKSSLRLKRSLDYPREGWGLTYDGRQLIASDGSSRLYFLDPRSLKTLRVLEVHAQGQSVAKLNELEYVDGEIFANIFESDKIARISPVTGAVTAWLDLSRLFPETRRPEEDVLNGIAYDAKSRHLLITGKHWPQLYEIALPSQ